MTARDTYPRLACLEQMDTPALGDEVTFILNELDQLRAIADAARAYIDKHHPR